MSEQFDNDLNESRVRLFTDSARIGLAGLRRKDPDYYEKIARWAITVMEGQFPSEKPELVPFSDGDDLKVDIRAKELGHLFVAFAAEMFRAANCQNYIEWSAFHPEMGELVFTLQRADGIKPSEKATNFENAIKQIHKSVLAMTTDCDDEIYHFADNEHLRETLAVVESIIRSHASKVGIDLESPDKAETNHE